jgi:hypothetical protein
MHSPVLPGKNTLLTSSGGSSPTRGSGGSPASATNSDSPDEELLPPKPIFPPEQLKQLRNVQAKVGRQFSRLFQVDPHHHHTATPSPSSSLIISISISHHRHQLIANSSILCRKFHAIQQGARCGLTTSGTSSYAAVP